VSGKTKLILKVPDKGPVPSNYWLITCLPVMWKLFSGKKNLDSFEQQ